MHDGATWLESDNGEQIVCEPQRSDRVWYETWLVLDRQFPQLSRLWVGGGSEKGTWLSEKGTLLICSEKGTSLIVERLSGPTWDKKTDAFE